MSDEKILKSYLLQNSYDKRIAKKEVERFQRQKDILHEFCCYLQTEKFGENLISEQGYTAETLYTQYKTKIKTVFAAYDYLIFLREQPSYALDMIKRRFPQK